MGGDFPCARKHWYLFNEMIPVLAHELKSWSNPVLLSRMSFALSLRETAYIWQIYRPLKNGSLRALSSGSGGYGRRSSHPWMSPVPLLGLSPTDLLPLGSPGRVRGPLLHEHAVLLLLLSLLRRKEREIGLKT